MRTLLLWTMMAHTSGHTVLTVDRMVPPPNARICPAFDLGTRTPERSGDWRFAPDILVCHRGPVSMTRVRKAVKFWEKMGYTFGNVEQAPPDHFGCAVNKTPFGTITIDIPSQRFQMGDHLGTTRTWRGPDGVIIKAKVEILPAWGATERILEHEIGHALGWGDVRHTGHIMNSVWSLGGHGTEGLKNETPT